MYNERLLIEGLQDILLPHDVLSQCDNFALQWEDGRLVTRWSGTLTEQGSSPTGAPKVNAALVASGWW